MALKSAIQPNKNEKLAHVAETAIFVPENAKPPPSQPSPIVPTDEQVDGWERAALAAVFGVQEYTVASTLWHRHVDQAKQTTVSKKPAVQTEVVYKKTANVPSLILPDIPAVSNFNDLMIETGESTDLFSSSPLPSVAHYVPAPALEADKSLSPSHTSTPLGPTGHEKPHVTFKPAHIQPPLVFINPPSIFDLLKSDNDGRVIVWSAKDASQTPSTFPVTQEPYAAAPAETSERPATLQGFSSNTTSASANQKRRSRLVHSARQSAQALITDGFSRLSRQKSMPLKKTSSNLLPSAQHQDDSVINRRSTPQLLKRASFVHRNSSDKNAINTSEDHVSQKLIKAASVEKLVEILTNSLDYTFMTDFFLTFRSFITPCQLCKLLVLRFRWALESDDDDRLVVRVRTFVVMRHWLLNYFLHDFVRSRELRVILTTFLTQLPRHPSVVKSPRDQRILQSLKRIVKQLKASYYRGNKRSQRNTHSLDADGNTTSDHNGSVDSELSPGASDTMDTEEQESLPNSVSHWKEEHIMAKLQDERRHREEEEERQRIEFFSATSAVPPTSSYEASLPNLQTLVESQVSPSPDSSGPVTPLGSIDDPSFRKGQTYNSHQAKRPPMPAAFQADAADPVQPLQQSPQQPPQPLQPPSFDAMLARGRQHIALPPTIIHDKTPAQESEHQIRRVPSSRWCKATPDESPAPLVPSTSIKTTIVTEHSDPATLTTEPAKLTKEPIPDGLSRHLSKKSIERRKSEKSLRDVSMSMASSTATSSPATTPRLTNTLDDNDIPELPPLPPAADVMAASAATAVLSSKLLEAQRQKAPPEVANASMASFQAVPYDATLSAGMPSLTPPSSKSNTKRRLSMKLVRMFSVPPPSAKAHPLPPPKTKAHSLPPPNAKPRSVPPINRSKPSAKPPLTLSSAPPPRSSPLQPKEPTPAPETAPVSEHPTAPKPPSEKEKQVESNENQPVAVTMLGRIAAELRQGTPEDDHIGLRRNSSINSEKVWSRFRRPRHGPIYLSHLVHAESDAALHIIEDVDESEAEVDKESEMGLPTRRLTRELSLLSNATTIPANIKTMSMIVEMDRRVSFMQLIDQGNDQEMAHPVTLQNEPQAPQHEQEYASQQIASFSEPLQRPSLDQPSLLSRQMPDPPTERPSILAYRSGKMVQQFCLIERDELLNVEWEELVDCRWLDGTAAIGGIHRLIQRFNTVCQWVATEIVTTKDFDKRVLVIRKFIHLAQKCKLRANFATLLQILLGLQLPVVSRLRQTWAQVGQAELQLLEQLAEFASPANNWRHIRNSMNHIAEEYGSASMTTQNEAGGCIPFIAIYLSDLIANADLPAYVPPYKVGSGPPLLQQPLVNFHKHRITATIIKRVLTFQNLARQYAFPADPELSAYCLHLPTIDMGTLQTLSHELE